MTLPHGFGSPQCRGYTRSSCPHCNPHLRKPKRNIFEKIMLKIGIAKERKN